MINFELIDRGRPTAVVSVGISKHAPGNMLGPSLGTLALSDSPNSLRRLVSNVVSGRVQTQLLPRKPGPGLASTGPAVPDTDPMTPVTRLNVRQRSTIALALFGGKLGGLWGVCWRWRWLAMGGGGESGKKIVGYNDAKVVVKEVTEVKAWTDMTSSEESGSSNDG